MIRVTERAPNGAKVVTQHKTMHDAVLAAAKAAGIKMDRKTLRQAKAQLRDASSTSQH